MDNPFNNQFKVPGFCEYFLYLDLSQLGVFVRKDEREKYRECKWVKNRADVGVFSLREDRKEKKKTKRPYIYIYIYKRWENLIIKVTLGDWNYFVHHNWIFPPSKLSELVLKL